MLFFMKTWLVMFVAIAQVHPAIAAVNGDKERSVGYEIILAS
jgi:hypothetical protein